MYCMVMWHVHTHTRRFLRNSIMFDPALQQFPFFVQTCPKWNWASLLSDGATSQQVTACGTLQNPSTWFLLGPNRASKLSMQLRAKITGKPKTKQRAKGSGEKGSRKGAFVRSNLFKLYKSHLRAVSLLVFTFIKEGLKAKQQK